MKWMRERDALIAQTMAFVQSVTGKGGNPAAPLPPLARDEPAAPMASPAIPSAPAAATVEPANAVPGTSRPIIASDVRREVAARIEGFRAHQERFNREREEYFNDTLGKVRAAIKDAPPLRSKKQPQ